MFTTITIKRYLLRRLISVLSINFCTFHVIFFSLDLESVDFLYENGTIEKCFQKYKFEILF